MDRPGERSEIDVIYLLTRPFAWLFKGLLFVVMLPVRTFRAVRDHRERKRVKMLASDLKAQRKQAAADAKAAKRESAATV